MDMTELPLFSLLKQRMDWLGQRQKLLSQNVANADTPHFAARDLKAADFEKTLRGIAGATSRVNLAVTDPMHIASVAKLGGYADYASPDKAADPLGNSVSLEQEMIKVADTQAQFQAATNLYAKALTMMKTAIGKSS
jgi:flagellar basal-body rod protein FlgB